MASGLLPKSPVSSSLCDEVPHIFIPKSHLEPREFLISSAKRLLQQYRHLADNPTALARRYDRSKTSNSARADPCLAHQLLSQKNLPKADIATKSTPALRQENNGQHQ